MPDLRGNFNCKKKKKTTSLHQVILHWFTGDHHGRLTSLTKQESFFCFFFNLLCQIRSTRKPKTDKNKENLTGTYLHWFSTQSGRCCSKLRTGNTEASWEKKHGPTVIVTTTFTDLRLYFDPKQCW